MSPFALLKGESPAGEHMLEYQIFLYLSPLYQIFSCGFIQQNFFFDFSLEEKCFFPVSSFYISSQLFIFILSSTFIAKFVKPGHTVLQRTRYIDFKSF
jgi:hypothetical protein